MRPRVQVPALVVLVVLVVLTIAGATPAGLALPPMSEPPSGTEPPLTPTVAELPETPEPTVLPALTATPAPVPTVTMDVYPAPAPSPPAPLPVVALPEGRRFVGQYTHPATDDGHRVDVEHAFISWEQAAAIDAAIGRARRLGRTPLLTIEPFTSAGGDGWAVIPETLTVVDGVGRNDATIRASARAIARHTPQTVLVRFAHEMELIDNYPWSQRDCGAYIAFYRRYHALFAAEGVTNVRWVWSPAGNQEAACYYPGDAYVDLVGLTVLGYEAWDLRWGAARGRSFADLYGEKERRVARFGKPIIVAELGVATGPERDGDSSRAYKAAWLSEAARVMERSPRLAGVVYFNAVNPPNAWTGDQPDWRVDPGLIAAIFLPRIQDSGFRIQEPELGRSEGSIRSALVRSGPPPIALNPES